MALSDEARQILAAAHRDWRALAGMADPEVFADEVFGFHAQQAVGPLYELIEFDPSDVGLLPTAYRGKGSDQGDGQEPRRVQDEIPPACICEGISARPPL